MSYTTIEQVRGHLAMAMLPAERTYDCRLVMVGDDYHTFHGSAVEEDSVVVRSPRDATLTRETIVLDFGGNTLAADSIVAGSVTVASDSSLGMIYIENTDYIIDYHAGRLIVKAGGNLDESLAVTVWYSPCAKYTPGDDFRIDAGRGRIARAAGGAIADGETVLVDYTPVLAGPGEEVLAGAVRTANSLVEHELDPEQQYEEDPILTTAATYKSLEIVCRAAAAGELASGRGEDRVALGWIKLADEYTRLAGRLMESYRPRCTPPASPST